MKNIHSFSSRLCHSPIPRRAAVMLVALLALTWSSPAFCDEIHDAARDGDLAKVQVLLKGNPDLVFSKDSHGWTPLHWAAFNGHRDVAELLLANHAEVNAKANNGRTPLHLAAINNHKDVAELLREHGGQDVSTPMQPAPHTASQASGPGARSGTARGATAGSAAAGETYRDLKDEDGIQFAIHGAAVLTLPPNYKAYMLGEFGLVDSGGRFIELELTDHNAVGGVIQTKRFGNIILKSTNPEAYAVTETQIRELHALLSTQVRQSTTPQGSRGPTWTDSGTGLMWSGKDNGADVTQQQAADFCQNLDLSGFRDWRLPTIDELSSLYNGPVRSSGISSVSSTKHIKGGITLTGAFTWSSSQGNSSDERLLFFFADGVRMSSLASTPDYNRALCVRRAGK